MTEAKLTWSIWQALLNAFAWAFTRRGFHHFAEWITAMAINVEEHTITQSVLALEQPAAWKALESFAEHGSWHQERVTQALTRLIATAPGRIWHGYQVSAVDDTKVHRSSPHVWGTCTFHEYTARCPNRAPTVRAHNWVVLGALLPEPEKPASFLPVSGRLYFRKSQLPVGPDGIVEFRTKCELAVELLREQARIIKGKHLAVFDGGYALESVVRPLVLREIGARYHTAVVDFADHDADQSFCHDNMVHLAPSGLVYFSQVLDGFFHDEIPRQPELLAPAPVASRGTGVGLQSRLAPGSRPPPSERFHEPSSATAIEDRASWTNPEPTLQGRKGKP